MSEQKQNTVLAEIDQYLARHGRAITRDNRARAAQGVAKWRTGYKAALAAELKQAAVSTREQRTSASDDALVAEWLQAVNVKRRADALESTSGIPLAPLELGHAPGMVSPEAARMQAREWFESRKQAAAAAREQEVTRAASQQRVEDARIAKILHEPMPSDDAIWNKYKHAVQPLTTASIETYSQHWPVEDLRRQAEAARTIAGLEVANVMTGEVTADEWGKASAWIAANSLDPTFASSWGIAITVLVEHHVIRNRNVPTVNIIPDPVMPEVAERTAESYKPMGRGAEQAQREADTLRDIRAAFGDVLTEIEQHDAVNPAEDAVIFNAYDELLKTRSELTRSNVRKAIFYGILKIRGQRPAYSAFGDEEIEGWADQNVTQQVSADEFRRQTKIYGDVKLSRVGRG